MIGFKKIVAISVAVCIFALIPLGVMAEVLQEGWENASIQELKDALNLISSKIEELESNTEADGSESQETESELSDASFLKDMSEGLSERWESSNIDTSLMSVPQQKEYLLGLVNSEVTRIEKYEQFEFADEKLGKYAHDYISGIQDQYLALTEYFGVDDVQYDEIWQRGYRTRQKGIFFIHRNYGLTIPAKYNETFKQAIELGKYYDAEDTVKATIVNQLESVDLAFTRETNYGIETKAFTFDNDTNYEISPLAIDLLFLDKDGNTISSRSLFTGFGIGSHATVKIPSCSIGDEFDKIAFICQIGVTTDYFTYGEQFTFRVIPEIQYAYRSNKITRDGELTAGQPIIEVYDVKTKWIEGTGSYKGKVKADVKFKIRNVGTVGAKTVEVKCVIQNKETKEIVDSYNQYAVSFSDNSLEPNYSKDVEMHFYQYIEKAKTKNAIMEIYVDDVLTETVAYE